LVSRVEVPALELEAHSVRLLCAMAEGAGDDADSRSGGLPSMTAFGGSEAVRRRCSISPTFRRNSENCSDVLMSSTIRRRSS
jgi:hypothetical protein